MFIMKNIKTLLVVVTLSLISNISLANNLNYIYPNYNSRQVEFHKSLKSYYYKYLKQRNELTKSEVYNETVTYTNRFCNQTNYEFANWEGKVSSIRTSFKGSSEVIFDVTLRKEGFTITFRQFVTNNDIIYQTIRNLAEGDRIIVSGLFENRRGQVIEYSFTEKGRLGDPEFKVIFYEIQEAKSIDKINTMPNENSIAKNNIISKKKLHQLCVNQIPFFNIDSKEFECFYNLSIEYLEKNSSISIEGFIDSNLMDFYKKCYKISSSRIKTESTITKYTSYITIVNLNLRSKPSTNSEILIQIPKYEYLEGENSKNSETKSTYIIDGDLVTSNWIYTEYDSIKGWVFKGGLEKINK